MKALNIRDVDDDLMARIKQQASQEGKTLHKWVLSTLETRLRSLERRSPPNQKPSPQAVPKPVPKPVPKAVPKPDPKPDPKSVSPSSDCPDCPNCAHPMAWNKTMNRWECLECGFLFKQV